MFKTLPTWVLILCYYKLTSNYSLVINGTVPYLLVCFKLLFWTTISTRFFLNNPYFITLLITCNLPYFWHFLPPSYCRCYVPIFPLLYIGLYNANLILFMMYFKFFEDKDLFGYQKLSVKQYLTHVVHYESHQYNKEEFQIHRWEWCLVRNVHWHIHYGKRMGYLQKQRNRKSQNYHVT